MCSMATIPSMPCKSKRIQLPQTTQQGPICEPRSQPPCLPLNTQIVIGGAVGQHAVILLACQLPLAPPAHQVEQGKKSRAGIQ